MRKPSLAKRFLLLASMMGAVTSFAQTTTTVDYAAWSTSQCNAFGNSPTINGLVHKTIIGQPQYSSPDAAVTLQCQYNGSAPYGTRYEIQYNFVANHQYTITVFAAAITNNYFPMLNLQLTGNVLGGGSLCNGPSSISEPSGSQNQGVLGNSYSNYVFNFNPGQNNSRLYVSAIADYSSQGTSAIQWIYVKRVVITDNTPPTPTFNLTASSNTRRCGIADPFTFTVQNPGGATVSQYKFYPEAGKWLYNGNPAPAEIIVTPPTNSISLTSVACANNAATVSAKAVWNSQNINTNTQSVAVALPTYSIKGPNALPMVSANYELMGNPLIFPTPPAGLPCGATVSWGNSNHLAANLYVSTPTLVGISPNTQYMGFPVTIVLSAEIQACGISTTVNKNITISDPFFAPISWNSYQGNDNAPIPLTVKSLSPNPTDGRFVIELSKSVTDASVYVRDIAGNLVSTQKRSGQIFNMDISSVSAGTYLVEIVSGNQSVVEKIVKK